MTTQPVPEVMPTSLGKCGSSLGAISLRCLSAGCPQAPWGEEGWLPGWGTTKLTGKARAVFQMEKSWKPLHKGSRHKWALLQVNPAHRDPFSDLARPWPLAPGGNVFVLLGAVHSGGGMTNVCGPAGWASVTFPGGLAPSYCQGLCEPLRSGCTSSMSPAKRPTLWP